MAFPSSEAQLVLTHSLGGFGGSEKGQKKSGFAGSGSGGSPDTARKGLCPQEVPGSSFVSLLAEAVSSRVYAALDVSPCLAIWGRSVRH